MRALGSILVLVALVALALVAAPFASADDGGRPFNLTLTGDAERPGPGDPDGTGTAHLRLNPGQGEVCYEYSVSDVAPLTAAHIHRAPVTDPGPVVIPTPKTSDTGGVGCVSADRELILEIIRNPAGFYFNVHNADFPAGALRAQLG